MRLVDLLSVLLNETDVQRLRLSSVEPMDWSDELLQFVADSPRIAKHIHIPLQSGSDTVLRRMHRRYRPKHYESRVRLASELMPDAAIGADVMVGFPGERRRSSRRRAASSIGSPLRTCISFRIRNGRELRRPRCPDQVPESLRKARGRVLKQLGEDARTPPFGAGLSGRR